MIDNLLPLLPPLVVLAIGLLTHNIVRSLIAGIALSLFLVHGFDFISGGSLLIKILMKNTINSPTNMGIFSFLFLLGVLVKLMQMTGGSIAYQRIAIKKVKSSQGVELSSVCLSIPLVLDDYLSCLTVGSVIKPLCSWYKVSRLKLAYLVDSMSAPLTILCPISSWVAAIIGFFKENGITSEITSKTVVIANPFYAYLSILPYMFYSFLTLLAVIFICYKKISFGPLFDYEYSLSKEDAPDNKTLIIPENKEHVTVLDFFAPVILLFIGVVVGCLFFGGWTFGGEKSFLQAIISSDIAYSLLFGSAFSLTISIIWFYYKRLVDFSEIKDSVTTGFSLMFPAILVLILAWSLGDLLRSHLNTGEVLASYLKHAVNINFLPVIFFVLSTMMAFAMGSSWGTAAILFPIAIDLVLSLANINTPIPLSESHLIILVVSALISGAIAGDHMSPISDTSIMTAASTNVNLMQHIKTQLPYATIVFIATGVSFLIAPFLLEVALIWRVLIPLSMGAILIVLSMSMLNKNK